MTEGLSPLHRKNGKIKSPRLRTIPPASPECTAPSHRAPPTSGRARPVVHRNTPRSLWAFAHRNGRSLVSPEASPEPDAANRQAPRLSPLDSVLFLRTPVRSPGRSNTTSWAPPSRIFCHRPPQKRRVCRIAICESRTFVRLYIIVDPKCRVVKWFSGKSWKKKNPSPNCQGGKTKKLCQKRLASVIRIVGKAMRGIDHLSGENQQPHKGR